MNLNFKLQSIGSKSSDKVITVTAIIYEHKILVCFHFREEPADKRAKNGAGDAQTDYSAYWAQYQVRS